MWARPLAISRAALAFAFLVFQLFLAPVDFVWFTMATALYAASSLFAALQPALGSEQVAGQAGSSKFWQ